MRPSERIPDPDTGRRTQHVAGIGHHKRTNRYRIRYRQGNKWFSDYFPVTQNGLRDAKRRRAELDRQPTLPIPADANLRPEMGITLIDPEQLGYLDRQVPDGSILANDERAEEPVQLDPAWLRSAPPGQREAAVRAVLPKPEGTPPIGETEHPEGAWLKLREVGELYRDWYAHEHCGVNACQDQADAHNAAIAERNAALRARRKAREA